MMEANIFIFESHLPDQFCLFIFTDESPSLYWHIDLWDVGRGGGSSWVESRWSLEEEWGGAALCRFPYLMWTDVMSECPS